VPVEELHSLPRLGVHLALAEGVQKVSRHRLHSQNGEDRAGRAGRAGEQVDGQRWMGLGQQMGWGAGSHLQLPAVQYATGVHYATSLLAGWLAGWLAGLAPAALLSGFGLPGRGAGERP